MTIDLAMGIPPPSLLLHMQIEYIVIIRILRVAELIIMYEFCQVHNSCRFSHSAINPANSIGDTGTSACVS